jgi:hypothetical protein
VADPYADEAAAVAAFLRRHDLPGLVDVHTHFMPERVLTKVWDYFDEIDGHPHLSHIEWPIRYRGEEAERLATLRSFGVRRFTSMLYPHKPGMAAWLNAWAAGFAAATPECAHTATFFAEPEAPGYVAAAIEDGAQIFKCHLQVGGFDPADGVLDGVWATLSEAQVPVVVHCGNGPERGRHTGPEPIREVLRRHPRLPLIVAHMGMPEYADFLDLADTSQNVWLDTTMVFTGFTESFMPFPPGLVPRLMAMGDRVVLGSDFPNIPYPFLTQLKALAGLGLGDDWLRAVCWDNGIRLLGPIDGQAAAPEG